MHVMWVFPDTTEANSIRYTQYLLQYDTDPIIVRSLLCTWLKSEPIKPKPNRNRGFYQKNRPKPTANPKIKTVTALLDSYHIQPSASMSTASTTRHSQLVTGKFLKSDSDNTCYTCWSITISHSTWPTTLQLLHHCNGRGDNFTMWRVDQTHEYPCMQLLH